MEKNEEIQQKYMQFQLMQQQLEQVGKHLEMLQEQNAELNLSLEAIRELEKAPLNNEFLAPIANGIFVKGELKDNKKMIVNVGSGVTVEKTAAEILELLQNQRRELTANLLEAEAVMQQLQEQTLRIYQELQKAAGEE